MKVEKPARQALIVLGMHRSGTSALSGVLAKLGARPPATLMPPTSDNPRGYWESSALMQFHDDVLESAGTRWSDWDRFNEDWIESPVARPFMERLASLLEQEFGDAPLFLVKDPRMCRMMPLWRKVLGEANIEPKVVIPIRHPLEVFGSLAARDHITAMRAQLVWLRYNLEGEIGSRDLARCFVRYSDLLADWRRVVSGISQKLDLKWPSRSSMTEAEIEAYLSSGLRHHVAPDEPAVGGSQIGTWVAAAYQAIKVLMGGGDAAEAFRDLDQVRHEFDRTSAIYAPVLYEARSELEQMIGESGRKLAGASQALEEQSARHELLKQENQANYELAMTHKAAFDELREQYQSREDAHGSLQARCERLQADLAQRQQLHEAEIEKLSGLLAQRQQLHEVEIEKLSALLAQRQQLHEAEIGKLSTLHQSEMSGMSARIQEREATTLELESKHRIELAALGTRLQTEIRDIKASRQLSQESVQERFAEIAMLTNRVFGLETQAKTAAASARETEKALKDQAFRLETKLSEADARVGDASAQNRALRLEVEALARLVAEYRMQLERIHASGAWKLAGIARKAVGKAPMIPPAVEDAREDEHVLRESKLFDRTWYNQRYQDVSARKMDPVRHYLKYGAKEGRDPGPAFSTSGYRARYPDVEAAGINPLVHYLKHGRKEGRMFSPLEGIIDSGVDKRAAKD